VLENTSLQYGLSVVNVCMCSSCRMRDASCHVTREMKERRSAVSWLVTTTDRPPWHRMYGRQQCVLQEWSGVSPGGTMWDDSVLPMTVDSRPRHVAYADRPTSGHHTSAATHARPLKTDINLLIYDSAISAALRLELSCPQ